MIEVLMLLAIFATNILKPISKALENYDGLMSLAELIVEGLFLLLVLKEFKMTKQSFEWTRKDRREEKTKRELCYFVVTVLNDYKMRLGGAINKGYEEAANNIISESYVQNYCQEVSNTRFLPISFCKETMENAWSYAYQQSQTPEETKIDANRFYNSLVIILSNFASGFAAPRFINRRKKHFKSDDEIDAIYEKLTNIEL